jgi:hypothetical protein
MVPSHLVDQLHPDRLAPPGELAKSRLGRRGDSAADRHVIVNDYTV